MKLFKRLDGENVLRDAIVIALATALFFFAVLCLYSKAGSLDSLGHSPYDSYTLQALAWRRGEVKLDKNYPWLELAIVNESYLSEHGRDDYEAYCEYFGGVNELPKEYEENEYYVSFPPVPSIPMFFLTFIFGENTPSGLMSLLYTVLAFLFAVLTAKRTGLNAYESVGISFLGIFTSSALFLACNKIVGGVWFQAQTLSLMLTMLAFFLIQGKKESEVYWSFAVLALAVGARPFQIVYFFYLAYEAWRRKNCRLLKTWKYYVAPAAIGLSYMIYNFIRFKNPLEFGHNYLPEFMRVPDGQFGASYLAANFKTAVLTLPEKVDGKIQYPSFGFAFYVSNVIFAALLIVFLARLINFAVNSVNKQPLCKRICGDREVKLCLLTALMFLHTLFLMLHKTWGGWQFGSRYMVDVIPAAVTAMAISVFDLKKTRSGNKVFAAALESAVFLAAAAVFVVGLLVNVKGVLNLF